MKIKPNEMAKKIIISKASATYLNNLMKKTSEKATY